MDLDEDSGHKFRYLARLGTSAWTFNSFHASGDFCHLLITLKTMQSVASLMVDSRVMSLIPAEPHTFMEIDQK